MRLRHLFAGLTLLAVVLGAFALVILGETVRQLDRLALEQREAGEIARGVSALLTLSHEFILHREPRAQQQWKTRYDRLTQSLESAQPTAPADRQMRADILDSVRALPGLFEGLQLTHPDDAADALTIERREFLVDRLLTETQSVAENAFQWEEEAGAAHSRLERRLTTVAIAGPALLAFLFAVASHFLAKRILRSLQVLQANMAAVATGDLTARNQSQASDELGDLARGFDHMAAELQARDQALAAGERFLRSVTDNLPLEIAYLDRDTRYRFMNRRHVQRHPGLAGALGQTPEQATGGSLTLSFNERVQGALKGQIQSFEEEFIDAEEQRESREFTLVPDLTPNGTAQGVFLVGIDVTERRRQQAHIERALSEKEVLLREIHHRVKNNLQVISSLLQLQSRQLPDSAARAALAESQDRIRSMALIHEKLYQGNDFAWVDFEDYVRSLVSMQHSFQGELAARVEISVEADAAVVEIDRAIPAGLLLNELLSNAFKHAFPNGRLGTIDVRLRALADGRIRLMVADNGVGVAQAFNRLPNGSLGLQLVHTLAQQLGGTLDFGISYGFACTVEFSRFTSSPPKP